MRKITKNVASVAAVMALTGLVMSAPAFGVERLTVKDGADAVKFVVHDSGNTGIGTATPAGKLDVREAVVINATTKLDPIGAYYNNGILRSKLRLDGVQDWYLNGGDNLADKGRIQYSTPGGGVGILLQQGATYDQNAAQLSNYPNLSSAGPAFVVGYGGAADSLVINKTSTNFGINAMVPTTKLDIGANAIRLRVSQSPAATAACNQGEIAWDSTAIYVCTASGAWKKAALSSY